MKQLETSQDRFCLLLTFSGFFPQLKSLHQPHQLRDSGIFSFYSSTEWLPHKSRPFIKPLVTWASLIRSLCSPPLLLWSSVSIIAFTDTIHKFLSCSRHCKVWRKWTKASWMLSSLLIHSPSLFKQLPCCELRRPYFCGHMLEKWGFFAASY